MKLTNSFLFFFVVFATCNITSCTTDNSLDDQDNKEEQRVPASRAEAEAKIEGKWQVTGSGDVQSVEFLSGGVYILQVSAENQGLIGTVRRQKSMGSKDGWRSSFVAQTNTIGTVFTTGTYSVSADGKTITLDQFASITITNLTENNFSFSINFTEGDKTIEVSLQVAPSVASSDKTNLLTRTWVYGKWPATFTQLEIAELTRLGLKLNDMKYIFTKSGTFIMPVVDFSEAVSADPDVPNQYNYSLDHIFAIWEWKNNQQNTITITAVDSETGRVEKFEAIVGSLDNEGLKFSTWPGDIQSLELIPVS